MCVLPSALSRATSQADTLPLSVCPSALTQDCGSTAGHSQVFTKETLFQCFFCLPISTHSSTQHTRTHTHAHATV